jgi:hypothetical protein
MHAPIPPCKVIPYWLTEDASEIIPLAMVNSPDNLVRFAKTKRNAVKKTNAENKGRISEKMDFPLIRPDKT